jgi:indole-3-glycerol phosphate synthase
MPTVLEEICAKTRLHVEASKARVSLDELKTKIQSAEKPRGFLNALRTQAPTSTPAMITEVKKASPSKGLIRADFDPAAIAKTYKDHGATCISVLTDEPYFQGHDDYLVTVKNTVDLPVLRKDFMIDEYQIYESRALGADCILLIMACLTDTQAKEFYDLAKQLGMDVLVEIHDDEELTRALKFAPDMIGINNRNLKTLSVDVQTSFDLVEKIPASCLKISESGLSDYATIKRLQSKGFGAFLVGESLMRQAEIGPALQTLIGNSV